MKYTIERCDNGLIVTMERNGTTIGVCVFEAEDLLDYADTASALLYLFPNELDEEVKDEPEAAGRS